MAEVLHGTGVCVCVCRVVSWVDTGDVTASRTPTAATRAPPAASPPTSGSLCIATPTSTSSAAELATPPSLAVASVPGRGSVSGRGEGSVGRWRWSMTAEWWGRCGAPTVHGASPRPDFSTQLAAAGATLTQPRPQRSHFVDRPYAVSLAERAPPTAITSKIEEQISKTLSNNKFNLAYTIFCNWSYGRGRISKFALQAVEKL